MEAGGEGDVAELVDGYLSQEFLGEVQGETRPQRIEHGLEFLAGHRGQAGDKFVQFLVRHGVYTQENTWLVCSRPADYKETPAGVLLRIDRQQGRIECFCGVIEMQCGYA